jgi:LuxR family maltose regulon positive regulatory protein
VLNFKKNTSEIIIPNNNEHLIRPRINALLTKAVKKPLTMVYAGMGCGKTRAIYDFTQKCKIPVLWMQFSDSENNPTRFWEMFCHNVAKINKSLAMEMKKLGFPDNDGKLNIYFAIRDKMLINTPRIYVLDDFHFLKTTTVLNFAEQCFYKIPKDCFHILISREIPKINISELITRNELSIISEDELNFTENELYHFLIQQGLYSEIDNLSKIYNDTKGWAFIINLVARLLKKTPGYSGYVKGAIKQDISQLMEAEVWNVISPKLKNLLLHLSLSSHASSELVSILAQGDENLVSELKEQNAFIRFDRYMDSYQIHHFLLDFLCAKQSLLFDDEKQKTYKIVADWCAKNDLVVDSLRYYEKIGDYNSIVSILFKSSQRFLMENAYFLFKIFNQAPKEIFDHVELSAAIHIHLVMNLAIPQKTLELIKHYEAKYIKLPEDDFRNRMLGCVYYYWAVFRILMCTVDDCYDFDIYFSKLCDCFKDYSLRLECWYQHPPGVWTNRAGSARTGAPQEFLAALINSEQYLQKSLKWLGAGLVELCQSELYFYQGDINKAESHINKAILKAQKYNQYEIVYRALFYLIRIAVYQGDYKKATQAIKAIESQLVNNEYANRFLVYDIVSGWSYCTLNRPERISGWLKENFAYKYKHINSFENYGNYVKIKHCYLTKKYTDLLRYMEEKKQQVTVIYERVELLVMEACVYLKTEDKYMASVVLKEAWETAEPNGIVMPFIEMGKDMQTLASITIDSPSCSIPRPWLKSIKQRASSYFRNQALIISDYKKTNEMNDIALSPREKEILRDLYNGLSRSEISAKYGLSINTVKLHINGIYNKTGARNRADIFRIVDEYHLLQ